MTPRMLSPGAPFLLCVSALPQPLLTSSSPAMPVLALTLTSSSSRTKSFVMCKVFFCAFALNLVLILVGCHGLPDTSSGPLSVRPSKYSVLPLRGMAPSAGSGDPRVTVHRQHGTALTNPPWIAVDASCSSLDIFPPAALEQSVLFIELHGCSRVSGHDHTVVPQASAGFELSISESGLPSLHIHVLSWFSLSSSALPWDIYCIAP
jgi:hypothetical protein